MADTTRLGPNWDPVKDIVADTGLPREIRPACPYKKLEGYRFALSPNDYVLRYEESKKYQEVLIHRKVIQGLGELTAEQILGEARLVRTTTQLTAMISLSEVAMITFDVAHRQLLWALLKLIEHRNRKHFSKNWRENGKALYRYELISGIDYLKSQLIGLQNRLSYDIVRVEERVQDDCTQVTVRIEDEAPAKTLEAPYEDTLSDEPVPPTGREHVQNDKSTKQEQLGAAWLGYISDSSSQDEKLTRWEIPQECDLRDWLQKQSNKVETIGELQQETPSRNLQVFLGGLIYFRAWAESPSAWAATSTRLESEKVHLAQELNYGKITGVEDRRILVFMLTKDFQSVLRFTYELCDYDSDPASFDWIWPLVSGSSWQQLRILKLWSAQLLLLIHNVETKFVPHYTTLGTFSQRVRQLIHNPVNRTPYPRNHFVGTFNKTYVQKIASIGFQERDGSCYLLTEVDSPELEAFRNLSKWLACQSSLFSIPQPWPFPALLSLDEEKVKMQATGLLKQGPSIQSYWKTNPLSADIFQLHAGQVDDRPPGSQDILPYPGASDYLMLTAAAPWSLFDNALNRIPNCRCTFRTPKDDFLQFQCQHGQWLTWHFTSTDPQCEGKHCSEDVSIALTDQEVGISPYTNTPCILGWVVSPRYQPDQPLWEILGPAGGSKRKFRTQYEVTGFQPGALLTVPGGVGPQLGGVVTFSKRRFVVANSIDSDSEVAIQSAGNAIVLVYDETRKIHLVLNGAEIIELCCIQFLRDVGYDTGVLPSFPRSSALQRIPSWTLSTFDLPYGARLTGDSLIRQAAQKVSQLVMLSKSEARASTRLLYWSFEDVLKGKSSWAIKPPKFAKCSWKHLANAQVPLILVVGKLSGSLLTTRNTCFSRSHQSSKHSFSDIYSTVSNRSNRGGILINMPLLDRWVKRCESFLTASLTLTNEMIWFGDHPFDHEYIFTATKCGSLSDSKSRRFGFCACIPVDGEGYLHYIQ